MKRVKVEGMCHQLVKAKLKRIVAKDFQIIYIKKDTLIEIVIKVIGHKRTDMRVKRLFYNMDSVLARAEGIFLQPERPAQGRPNKRSVLAVPATNGSDCCGLLCFFTHAKVCITRLNIHTTR
jgi:hypothetical protein